jgi:pyruvate dehydrogenase E1 component
LRRYFEVDAAHVCIAALAALASDGVLSAGTVAAAIRKLEVDPESMEPRLL